MAKIAVFDSGWGGDICAEYLSLELGVFQIDRIIDWKNFPYSYRTPVKIRSLVRSALKPHIGKYDVIVISNSVASLHALKYIKEKYSEQKFVGMPFLIDAVKTLKTSKVMVLSTSSVLFSREYRKILDKRRGMAEYTIVTCDGWLEKIDSREFTIDDVAEKMKNFETPDIVLLECTQLLRVKKLIEGYFGWRAQVIDANTLLLRDVCRAIKISNSTGKKLPSVFRKVGGRE